MQHITNTDPAERTTLRWVLARVTVNPLPRAAMVGSLILLTGSIDSWQRSDEISGTLEVSPAPSALFLRALIDSEGEFAEDSGEMGIDIALVIYSAEARSPDNCLELTVVVRDEAGEIVVDNSTVNYEDCDGLLTSLGSDLCAGLLPGRCDLTFEVEVSAPEEAELTWGFGATVVGTLGCNDDMPSTYVDVSTVDISR